VESLAVGAWVPDGDQDRRQDVHDLDRTQLETWQEVDEFESDEYGYTGEAEWYGEGEIYGEAPMFGEAEIYGEANGFGEAELYGELEMYGEVGGVFNETDEMALAAELLAVSNEEELEQFLGKLIRSASRTVGRAVRSPVGRAIGGMLKGVARRALPMVGGALGNLVVPGLGGMVGSQLASRAGAMFGLEFEGLSAEDQQFEIARRIVRLGGGAIQQAAMAPPGRSPQAVARAAMLAASRRYAPGLAYGAGRTQLNGSNGAYPGVRRRQGRWYRSRNGRNIVLVGA
jgi:hypothetical protein